MINFTESFNFMKKLYTYSKYLKQIFHLLTWKIGPFILKVRQAHYYKKFRKQTKTACIIDSGIFR